MPSRVIATTRTRDFGPLPPEVEAPFRVRPRMRSTATSGCRWRSARRPTCSRRRAPRARGRATTGTSPSRSRSCTGSARTGCEAHMDEFSAPFRERDGGWRSASPLDDYLAARRRRFERVADIDALLGDDVVLVCPTHGVRGVAAGRASCPASTVPRTAEGVQPGEFNMTGHPSLSVPAGALRRTGSRSACRSRARGSATTWCSSSPRRGSGPTRGRVVAPGYEPFASSPYGPEVVAEPARQPREEVRVNGLAPSPASSRSSLRRIAAFATNIPGERIGSGGNRFGSRGHDRQAREPVVGVQRERRQDLAAEVRRADAVAGVAEPVVHVAAAERAEERQREPATSIGPPHAASIGTPSKRREHPVEVVRDATRERSAS